MMSIAELIPSRSEDRWRDSPEAGPSTYPLADEVEPRVAIRVLVSFEEEYHAYGDAIAGALGDLRLPQVVGRHHPPARREQSSQGRPHAADHPDRRDFRPLLRL